MTIINPKSIAGVTSITTASGADNLLTVHTNNTTERIRINNDGDVIVGSGITVSPDGDIFATGVTTSTTFVGALTGNVTGNATGLSGTPNISAGTIAGSTGTFTGDVDIADKIVHTGDTDTAIRFSGADTITAETGGSERVRITSTGLFGIGTTPEEIFHVKGPSETVSSRDGVFLQHNTDSDAADTGLPLVWSGRISSGLANYGLASICGRKENSTGGDGASYLQFATCNSAGSLAETLRITSGGLVRVGGDFNTDTAVLLALKSSGTAAQMQFHGSGTGDTSSDGLRVGYNGSGGQMWNFENTYIRFATNNSERVRIDTSGRLLVGTTSARTAFAWTSSAKIQSEGAYNEGSISSTNNENNSNTCAFVSAKIRGTGAVSNNDIVGSHVFEAYEGSSFRRVARIDGIARDSGGGISNNVISGDLVFYTRIDGNAEAEVVRLHHAKYALFGCTSLPSASVSGASIDCDPSDYPVFFKSSSANYGSNAYTHYQFFNSNGGVGQILVSGSGTQFLTSSDYRLKENETAITDGITRLKQLKPYKFNFKADSSTVLDGFFAHEVSSVVPEAASGEKDAVATEANVKSGIAENVGDVIPQGLDHAKLVPLLTAALQEAVTKIEVLETRLNNAGIAT